MSTGFANVPTRNDAHTMQNARHPLAALMDRVRELNGWSDSQLVERATKAGETLSKSNISRVRNTDVVSLTSSTIKGLAAGLGISESEVAAAALRSMGINPVDPGTLDLETVIRLDSTLSSDHRALLLSSLRQMRELEANRAGFAEKAHDMGKRASTLTRPNQGSQPDYELARRKGETESEWRERTGIDFD
jgi:transcriptional regulator with XRE-family HTH domain